MANADAPFGLRPVRHRNGAHYNGAANPYYVPSTYATDLFIGDPVIVTGTANTSRVALNDGDHGTQFPAGSLPEVNRATAGAGNDITGVIVGFGASPSDGLEKQYGPASTERVVWVADDPDLMFEAQEDSDGGALSETDVGQNIDLVAGSGDTTYGMSGWELDSSTAATGSTLQCRIERLANRGDNEVGTNAKWLVSILQHSMRNKTGV